MLDTAMGLMQSGLVPSVSDVAEAAGVSRATAYRYFPTQAALIQATVGEALGPILDHDFTSEDVEARIAELIAFSYPRIEEYEATHRATLFMSLDQWIRRQAGTLGNEVEIKRGNRRELLREAAKPLKAELGRQGFDRLTQSLSLIFGTEAFVVLKDIWGLDGDEARRVAVWAGHALVRQAIAEAKPSTKEAKPAVKAGKTPTGKKAAARPRKRRNAT